jgi:GDPmannose 4,6-dehydratase
MFSQFSSGSDPNDSWKGNGVDEQGIDAKTGKTIVKIDSKYFRPAEVECV